MGFKEDLADDSREPGGAAVLAATGCSIEDCSTNPSVSNEDHALSQHSIWRR